MSSKKNRDNNTADKTGQTEEKKLLSWSIHPAKNKPLTTMIIMGFILFSGYAIDFFIKEYLIAGAVVIVFIVSLKKWFLKTDYTVTDRGIRIALFGSKEFVPWEKISRVSKSGKGYYMERGDISAAMQGVKGLFIVTSPDMVFVNPGENEVDNRPDIEAALEKIFVNLGKI